MASFQDFLGGAGAFLVGGPQGLASYGASKAQQKGAKEAAGTVKNYLGQSTAYQQPYYKAGTDALGMLTGGMASGQYNAPQFNYTATNQPDYGKAPDAYNAPQFNFQADPGYDYRLGQSMNAIQGSAAAGGKLLSGATLKSMQGRASDIASDEYNNAYNRFANDRNFGYGTYRDTVGDYNTNRAFNRGSYESDRGFGYGSAADQYQRELDAINNNYNRTASIANMGASAGNNLSSLYNNAGGDLADLQLQSANAKAAGYMGIGQGFQNNMNQGVSLASNLIPFLV